MNMNFDVLHSQGNEYYDIKYAAEVVLGVVTQCFVDGRLNLTYCMNLTLKINAKLGGTNQIVSPTGMVATKGTKEGKARSVFNLGCGIRT
jgi:hypothetical protein